MTKKEAFHNKNKRGAITKIIYFRKMEMSKLVYLFSSKQKPKTKEQKND